MKEIKIYMVVVALCLIDLIIGVATKDNTATVIGGGCLIAAQLWLLYYILNQPR